MSAVAAKLMTTEELLAMPDDGVRRWLIRGELREGGMTYRNRHHARVTTCVSYYLEAWRLQQPEPLGCVLSGEAGVRLREDPDTTVGVDVVYISAELAAKQTEDSTLIVGVPVLVVEILSPNDTLEKTHEKIDDYLDAGVKVVWVVDPYDRTVRIYQPGEEPTLVNAKQELTAEPTLPGFRVPVAKLFG
jgi:Uma2 family endonuclease